MNINKQKMTTILLTSAMLLTLSSCGELSYKRGASATDFQQDKIHCSTEYKKKSDIESCLAKSGWLVVSVDKPLFAEATADITTVQTISDKKVTTEKAMDPLELIAVGSWWKIGAAPNVLITDSEKCVTELGEGHQTHNNMSLVTRGLVSCMSGQGWFALKQ